MSHSAAAGWAPILEGPLREKAERAIVEISNEIRRRFEPLQEALPAQRNASLADGVAGWAVLFRYLARARDGETAEAVDEPASRSLSVAADLLESLPLAASLYGGFTGIAWAGQHLDGLGEPDPGDEDPYEAIDEALEERLAAPAPWNDHYDLVSGLVGFGVYALERSPRPGGVACAERVLARLEETAEHGPEGAGWWTPPHLLTEFQLEAAPEGFFNLGMAHGVPGIITLLGQLHAARIESGRSKALLTEAVRWLLSRKQPETVNSRFATFTNREPQPPTPNRVAWCYGDLGVSLALLQAARCAGEPAWESEALAMARHAATRRGSDAHVVDSGLCHGAAGVAHCFNRLFHATRDDLFLDAARFWFGRALEMWPPGEGYASLKVWDNPSSSWLVKSGLLEGASGVALALLAATERQEPRWDRMLLASIPPR